MAQESSREKLKFFIKSESFYREMEEHGSESEKELKDA